MPILLSAMENAHDALRLGLVWAIRQSKSEAVCSLILRGAPITQEIIQSSNSALHPSCSLKSNNYFGDTSPLWGPIYVVPAANDRLINIMLHYSKVIKVGDLAPLIGQRYGRSGEYIINERDRKELQCILDAACKR